MKLTASLLSLLLIGFPASLFNLSDKKDRIYTSLSYYGSDYDGDGADDLSAWNPVSKTLYYQLSSTDKFYQRKFFEQSKLNYNPVFADYDGDGKVDFAFFQPDTGQWTIFNTTNPTEPEQIFYGAKGDVPLPSNFDGNKSYEKGIYRPNASLWLIYREDEAGSLRPSLLQQGNYQDNPISADYDGDGKSDLSVWRPDDGNWFILKSTNNYDYMAVATIEHGKQWDILVPNDYNGDGRYDLAFWRPSDKTWYIKFNEYMSAEVNKENEQNDEIKEVPADETLGFVQKIQFGDEGDIPLSADLNNDGIPELIMWNAKLKDWKIKNLKNQQVSSLKWNIPEGCLPANSIIHKF